MLTNKTSTVSKNNLKNLHFLSQTAQLLRFSYSFIEDTTMTNTTQPTVIILGASYAGLMACARLLHSRQKIQIMVIDAKAHFEQKIRLHETLVGDETRRFALAPLLKKRGVTFIQAKVNGQLQSVMTICANQEGIKEVFIMLNPEKLNIQQKIAS